VKILVTGAGGFIGAAVVRALAREGEDVRAHLGAPGDIVVHPPAGVEHRVFDITDPAAVASAVEGVESVVHLAGPAAVAASFDDPEGYARAHVVGTVAVVSAMLRCAVTSLVYVSSAEVYGIPERDPVDEAAPLQPRSPYGAAKVGAEAIVSSALRRGALANAVILRPFSVYGPGQRSNSLLSSLLRQAATATEVALDDLRPVRDYVFVDDVVRGILAGIYAARPDLTIANIGSGQGVSVGELARIAIKAAGREVPVRERGATRPAAAEILRLVADVTTAHRALGWATTTSLHEGLARTLSAAALT